MGKPFIEAALTLLPTSEGGRRGPLDLSLEGSYYRPHIVVGDASQRQAIVGKGKIIVEEYLGVQFRPAQVILLPSESARVIMDLLYYPNVDYTRAVPNAEFTLREGGRIVGYGMILRRSTDEAQEAKR
jgi:hypothetical protein